MLLIEHLKIEIYYAGSDFYKLDFFQKKRAFRLFRDVHIG